MSRPLKKGVDYFPHDTDASTRQTLRSLQRKYGNDGYAAWFKILENLGRSDNLSIDYSKEETAQCLSEDLRLSRQKTEEVIDFMADLEAIDYDLWHQSRVIYSPNFAERLKGVFSKRKSDREKKTPEKPVPQPCQTQEKHPKLVLNYPPPDPQPQQDDDLPFGLTQQDVERYQHIVNTIYDEAEKYGLPTHQGNIDDAVELVNKYSLEWVLEAIKRTGDGKEQTWRYLKGILRKWEAKGEIDQPADRNKPAEVDEHALDAWGGNL